MGSGIYDLEIYDDSIRQYKFSDRYTDVDSMIAAIARTIRHHSDSKNMTIEITQIEQEKTNES